MKKTNYKVGETYYDSLNFPNQKLIVKMIDFESSYPIVTNKESYTLDGRVTIHCEPTLSTTPYELKGFTAPIEAIEKDTLVYVRDKVEHKWVMRFYSHCESGIHYCFLFQKKSIDNEDVNSWNYCQTENPFI